MYSIHDGDGVPGLRCMLHPVQTDHCLCLCISDRKAAQWVSLNRFED